MTLKYRILLGTFRVLRMQKLMALPPKKSQKLFRMAYKGVKIPKMTDPELIIHTGMIAGSPVVWYKHKKVTGKLCIYLVGGGMLKYPRPSQAKSLIDLAKACDVDIMHTQPCRW